MAQVREIAEQKMGDMNAVDVDGAMADGTRVSPRHGPRSRGGLTDGEDQQEKMKAVETRSTATAAILWPRLLRWSRQKRRASKFDETIEIAMNLGVDPRHADQMVRGVVAMPNGTGKTMRVAVFARDAKADEAKAAGADLVGAEDLAEAIQGGESNFDRVIASPDMMGVVGRLGKVLGPRGLMPNPKLGTVTPDVAAAVKAAKAGEVQYRAEKAGVVHAGVGKASFDEAQDCRERSCLYRCCAQGAPERGKRHISSARSRISSTMGPGIMVEDVA